MNYISRFDKVLWILKNVSWRSIARLLIETFFFSLQIRSAEGRRKLKDNFKTFPISFYINGNQTRAILRRQDVPIFYEIFQEEVYKPLVIKEQKNDIFIDVGAHIGLVCMYAYYHISELDKIVAIEPSVGNFNLLKLNVGELEKVKILRLAVGSTDEMTSFNEDGLSYQLKKSKDSTVNVNQKTMKSIFTEHHIDKVSSVKMDVEGQEKEIFKNIDWLESVDELLMEIHPPFSLDDKAIVQLKEMGKSYEILSHKEAKLLRIYS